MKEMKTFHTMSDALSACNIQLSDAHRLTHSNGMQIFAHSNFQIRDLVIKEAGRIKWQVSMQHFY
jgi:hypothetical protein